MTFPENLKILLRAGAPALYVETHEWQRFHTVVQGCCKDAEVRKSPFFWNPMEGFDHPRPEGAPEGPDTADVLNFLNESELRDSVYVLEFFDRYLVEQDYPAFLAVAVRRLRGLGSHVIIQSPTLNIPETVRNDFTVLDFPLPERNDIKSILSTVRKDQKLPSAEKDDSAAILDSVRGLGSTEIWNAFSKAAVDRGRITAEEIPMLIEEKEQIIRKSGYLEFVRTEDASDIGGVNALKEWLKRRRNAFGAKAREANLSAPKGVLLLGVPGTGKSLCAKVVAREWKMPLLRLDMGRVFGGVVGESELNIRNAIKVAEGLEPCVLWIDEIEKGLSGGASSSGELDGGTSTRVFGSLLTWMQEKKKEVFVFATANDLSRMPPELLRKGRFDEIFSVDLPGKKAREAIFRIHLDRKGQNHCKPSGTLLDKTEGYSGSEIEAVVDEAVFLSYQPGKPPKVDEAGLLKAAGEMVPLSSTMAPVIAATRKWADKRCRKASDPDDDKPPNIHPGGGPRLRTEIPNPFVTEDEK